MDHRARRRQSMVDPHAQIEPNIIYLKDSQLKTLLPIEQVAAKLDLTEALYEKRTPVSAKLSLDLLKDQRFHRNGHLVLVTATTPTISGEGKTVTSIGLAKGSKKSASE